MDVNMPIMDGIQATQIITDMKKKQIVPANLLVIIVTAFNESSDKTKAEQAGCNIFLSKPVQIKDLYQIFH